MSRAPFQVLVIPFRRTDSGLQFCALLRSDLRIWQGIAGGGELGERPVDAARREAFEEAGIPVDSDLFELQTTASIRVDGFPDRASWPTGLLVIPEFAFAVDCTGREIRLSHEHTSAFWGTYDEVHERLRFDSNRTALWELQARLETGRMRPSEALIAPELRERLQAGGLRQEALPAIELRRRIQETSTWCASRIDPAAPATCLRTVDLDLMRATVDELVEHVVFERRRDLWRQPLGTFPGALLAYAPDEDLWEGTSSFFTDGFLDGHSCPPQDTWIAHLRDGPWTGRALIAWVPEALVPKVEEAIFHHSTGGLRWVSEEEVVSWLSAGTFPDR